ncbi:hypothetical protein I204_04748 [Kwoniella mangroviensis CBS 8886]|uniref:uncharacterized protein n=1 Tax=Kwoniella mangroviensis CBS 8507 TaxID=1296122 RepID=UPI00080CFCF6|nr:uncharacterized protein I203_04051 [Kwoniella mangroviensis CBS 8507]OCF66475.1 hypothetical protein I203_04051 [Kwoniella mangroviensis CBS 8507]OCF74377.1 hypothetical protein I204_04748 [Kwoniella mangroviensis CBS 8886]
MVKSQRSSTTLFHQWPNNHHNHNHNSQPPTTPSHQHQHQPSGGISSISTPFQALTSRSIQLNQPDVNVNVSVTPGSRAVYAPGLQNNSPTPGSPSQIDPFGSQVTSPAPIQLQSSSRPPSTVLSSGGSPLPGSNHSVVTPKIILASPSTSTIHYLFPSSDTKNGIHLSTSTSASTNITQEHSGGLGQSDGKPLKRGQSLSRGNSVKYRKNSQNIDQHQQSHREVPGLKNKRSLPTPNLKHQPEKENSSNPTKVNGPIGGVKKSDISKPYPSLSDEARDYSKGYYDVGPGADMMGTLRRQPGMNDLIGKNRVGLVESHDNIVKGGTGMKRRESIILKEIENRRERRGWEIGSRPAHGHDPIEPTSPSTKTKTSTNVTRTQIRGANPKPYIPPITVIQQRRRSQSLTSPRPAPSPPADPQKSPLLPAPDLGDPLSLSVVIPSPSYSHLEYSPAGSSASSMSRSQSKRGGWGKRSSAIFPLSVAMSRGETRKGLGTYDSAKLKAEQDFEQRTIWTNNGMGGKIASIKRSVSLRKKDSSDDTGRRIRPRSQSLTTTKSIRGLDEAPPLPSPSLMKGGYIPYGQEYTSEGYTGELSIDLGSRYHPHHPDGSSTTLEMDLASPRSAETSIFPASTPTSAEYEDHHISRNHTVMGDNVIRIVGRPLHPAFNESESSLSILAPSTVGLGFSPVGTPMSLPESLLEEAIDLTETGRRLSSPMIEAVITPPTPQNQGILPKQAFLEPHQQHHPKGQHSYKHSPCASPSVGSNGSGSGSQKIPRRSLLLAQNRFYIPPSHAKPSPPMQVDPKDGVGVGGNPALRSSKSLRPGIMKRAYTSGNLKADANCQPGPSEPSCSTSFGGLLKSASIRSNTNRFSRISENNDQQSHQQQHYGTERISFTSSMRFKTRPLTTFSICSPSDAIEPLPQSNSPSPGLGMETKGQTPSQSKTLRSNRSSPFLSASNSLRIIFGKDGFVARSLSQAFDKDHNNLHHQSRDSVYSEREREKSSSPKSKEELKLRISSPLEASQNSGGVQSRYRALSPEYEEEAREKGRDADKKWRESVLQEALSISVSNSSSLHKLANYDGTDGGAVPRMVSSGSKSRLAIPDQLLSAPNIRDSTMSNGTDGLRGIGESMLNSNNSLESSLNLRAVIMQVCNEKEKEKEKETGKTRILEAVGKEESMISAPSFYSNNASTYFEKPSNSTRRLQGKGLPSSFSIAELTKGKRSISKSKSKHEAKSDRLNIRQISQPIPMSGPLSYNDRIKTFDLNTTNPEEEIMGQLVDPSFQDDTRRSTNNNGIGGSMKGRNISARSSIFGLRSNSGSKSPEPSSNSRSGFGLSSRLSLRNKSVGKNGISSNDYPTSTNTVTSSSMRTSSHQHHHPAVIDTLLARDDTVQAEHVHLTTGTTNDRDKLRKVLEWRDEVGDNEHLARLEQKIRGFVIDERERVRDIGRKSIEG